MRVLVVGHGAREHALVWRLAQSPVVEELHAAPGNAGIAELARCFPVGPTDVAGLADLAERESIDLTVVGPEGPLVEGLADELSRRGLAAFGPSRAAARIEGSKVWAKELCERYGIPAPPARAFSSFEDAAAYLGTLDPPYVIKADGLAGGKGVTVAQDRDAAVRALRACLIEGVFGGAGSRVLIEEHVTGREVSALALTDGRDILPFPFAQDFKRLLDGDAGPNTGGMGAYAPVLFVDEGARKSIVEEVLRAAVRALEEEGTPYRGVLYAGLMLTDEGPKVLEFNCRFGDPEAEAILPLVESDLAELLLVCASGELGDASLAVSPRACVTVVLAAEGYPGRVRSGDEIRGLEAVRSVGDTVVFHASTARRGGRVVTAGGRVLAVTATGPSVGEARTRAYEACSLLSFAGAQYRTDIAARG